MDFLSNLRKLLGGDNAPVVPVRKMAQPISPSQRDFPNSTNYGVPEDNMIDTPQGYVTRQQYDSKPFGLVQSRMIPQPPQDRNSVRGLEDLLKRFL